MGDCRTRACGIEAERCIENLLLDTAACADCVECPGAGWFLRMLAMCHRRYWSCLEAATTREAEDACAVFDPTMTGQCAPDAGI